MYKLFYKHLIAIFVSISILILFSAYFIQYVLDYEACKLCLIGRIPYFLVIALGLISFFFTKLKKIQGRNTVFFFGFLHLKSKKV